LKSKILFVFYKAIKHNTPKLLVTCLVNYLCNL